MDRTQPSSHGSHPHVLPWQWPPPPPPTAPEHVLHRDMYCHDHEYCPHLKMKIPCMNTQITWVVPCELIPFLIWLQEAFSSFTNQTAILRVDTDNAQPQIDLSDMWPHDHVQEQEDNFSPPQNKQNSLKHENSQIPQAQGNVTVDLTVADVHTPPCHIDVQHGASSSSHDQGLIQEDDTMTEQNVANNTIVKKPHACDSRAAEAVAAEAGAEAVAAGVGAEASPPTTTTAINRQKIKDRCWTGEITG